jgi:hypothetical protein
LFRRAFTVLATTAYDFWDNLIVAVCANLIWSIFLIPALLTGFLVMPQPFSLMLVLLVLGLTAGFGTIGLHHMVADTRREERLEFGEYWRGIKLYWRRGLVLMLVNAAVAILIYANIYFYSIQFAGSPLGLLIIIWIYVGAVWLIMQMYVWAQAVRGDEFRLGTILRNALLVTFKYPQFTFPIGIIYFGVMIGLAVLIGVIPLIFMGAIFQAMLGNRAWNAVLERENELAERRLKDK